MLEDSIFRAAMRQWTTGVAVATSRSGDEIHGMTVNSFTSISLTPPTIAVSMNHHTRTHEMVTASKLLGITILADTQRDIADRFSGKTHEEENRFIGTSYFSLYSGVPLIHGGLAWFDCKVLGFHDLQTTTLFIAEVIKVQVNSDGKPLVYHNRSYVGLQ